MQSEELIREIQQGLLKWYDFKPHSTFLYLGEKTDACAVFLDELDGQLVCALEAQTVNKQWQQDYCHSFDYIIAIETLEKPENPKEFLKNWIKLLKADGTLLLGMNNRFGLRYFCGDRDPHTGRNFDGIEGYRRIYSQKDDIFQGRCYSQAEIRDLLRTSGFENQQFYSVLSDLKNPFFLYAEDYLPNEDLSNRLFPTYNYPETVFLEEERLYSDLIKNGMFHEMANAYLVECPLNGNISDVLHVTSSLERGRERSFLTIIRRSGTVEKRAAYEEGNIHLEKLLAYGQELSDRGIPVVQARLEGSSYIMPYIHAEVGHLYLKRLLQEDQEMFLQRMDEFRDLILQSSDIIRHDLGDGQGAVLQKGYLDMVPLNSFYLNGTFVFYDQEFCEENYPANALIWRMVSTFYAGNPEAQKLLPREILLKRYDLDRNLEKWQKMEADFLSDLLHQKTLLKYHNQCWRNYGTVYRNRQRMNYSAEEYQRLFVDIFRNTDNRKLVLFGSGNFTKRFLNLYRQEHPVYAVIDNNEEKWGQEVDGIPIQSPELLKQMRKEEYKVVVCIKNYMPVIKQLESMGVTEYSIFDSGIVLKTGGSCQ